MPHVFNPQSFRKLENPERRKLLPATKLLRGFGLHSGHIMVDVGAGTGYFVLPAKTIVGSKGKVIAVDGSKEMLSMLRQRARARHKTIQIINAKASATKLPTDSADVVLLSFVLHEVPSPAAVLREARRLLKPGGALAVIEWKPRGAQQGPPLSERIAIKEARTMMRDAGFTGSAAASLNPFHYSVTAVKAAARN